MDKSHRASMIEVIRASTQIFDNLGPSHHEAVYKAALACEMRNLCVAHRTEVVCPYFYGGCCVGYGKADIVTDSLVIEIKAVPCLYPKAIAQAKKYTAALSRSEGLSLTPIVINFGANGGIQTLGMDQDEESVDTPPGDSTESSTKAKECFARKYKICKTGKSGVLLSRLVTYLTKCGIKTKDLRRFVKKEFTQKTVTHGVTLCSGGIKKRREVALFPKSGGSIMLRV